METSEQSTSPTVFDMPPRETEVIAAPLAPVWLANAPESGAQAEVPKTAEPVEVPPVGPAPTSQTIADSPADSSEVPWFSRYVSVSQTGGSPPTEERSAPSGSSASAGKAPPPATTPDRVVITPLADMTAASADKATPTGATAPQTKAPAPEADSPWPLFRDGFEKMRNIGLTLRSDDADLVNTTRSANLRRSRHVSKLIALVCLANLVLLGAFGAWLHSRLTTELESRLGSAGKPGSAVSAEASSADAVKLDENLKSVTLDLKSQLQSAQQRLAQVEELSQQQAVRLKELTTAMANASSNSSGKGPPVQMVAAATVPGSLAPELALGPAQSELVLLKERNRLTAYADEAIATGAREPYDRLWQAFDDPRLANLIHASRSEILRVQNYYLSGSRLEHFDIPVSTYFPDAAALKDSQLKDEQLITLLTNGKNPWQVRMKAANLLGLRRSRQAGDALVKAVVEDPNLDVVKEATFSFEQMTGFRARLFEPESLDAWWKQYNALPPPPKAKVSVEKKQGDSVEKPADSEAKAEAAKSSTAAAKP